MREIAAVARVVEQKIDNLNRGNLVEALTTFSKHALVVDDMPPFRRTGFESAEIWPKLVNRTWKRLHGPLNLDASTRCYVEADQCLCHSAWHIEHYLGQAAGLLTFTHSTVEGTWLIDTAIWSNG